MLRKIILSFIGLLLVIYYVAILDFQYGMTVIVTDPLLSMINGLTLFVMSMLPIIFGLFAICLMFYYIFFFKK